MPVMTGENAGVVTAQAPGVAQTIPKLNDKGRMANIPLSPEAKITRFGSHRLRQLNKRAGRRERGSALRYHPALEPAPVLVRRCP